MRERGVRFPPLRLIKIMNAKYSADLVLEICKALEKGLSIGDAMNFCGVSRDTYYDWIKKPEFAQQVKKAELSCKYRNIQLIQKAAIDTWQAAAWWLERKYFDEFGLKTKQEISGYLESDQGKAEKKEMRENVRKFLEEVMQKKEAKWEKFIFWFMI